MYFPASETSAIVNDLTTRLAYYKSRVVPPTNEAWDERANPIYWNNTWTLWGDYLEAQGKL